MPPYQWKVDPNPLIIIFEKKYNNPEAGALLFWAIGAIDCLHYLDDLDINFGEKGNPIAGHNSDLVDVAHARWATSTAITSLDLIAAGLGRVFCGNTGSHEFDIRYLIKPKHKAQLPLQAQQWIDNVQADPQYSDMEMARHALMHKRLKRHIYLSTWNTKKRIDLDFNSKRLSVRDLIEHARDLATRHVLNFLDIIQNL